MSSYVITGNEITGHIQSVTKWTSTGLLVIQNHGSNTGKPITIEIQEKIFKEGFTTKVTGSGLGLYICKKSLEEQFAQLKLKKSDENLTEFEITLLKS